MANARRPVITFGVDKRGRRTAFRVERDSDRSGLGWRLRRMPLEKAAQLAETNQASVLPSSEWEAILAARRAKSSGGRPPRRRARAGAKRDRRRAVGRPELHPTYVFVERLEMDRADKTRTAWGRDLGSAGPWYVWAKVDGPEGILTWERIKFAPRDHFLQAASIGAARRQIRAQLPSVRFVRPRRRKRS
jgi:hypothetical protein